MSILTSPGIQQLHPVESLVRGQVRVGHHHHNSLAAFVLRLRSRILQIFYAHLIPVRQLAHRLSVLRVAHVISATRSRHRHHLVRGFSGHVDLTLQLRYLLLPLLLVLLLHNFVELLVYRPLSRRSLLIF